MYLIVYRDLYLYKKGFLSYLHPSRSITAVKIKRQTFIVIIMVLLEDPTNTNIVTWLPNSTSFAIICQKQITTELMQNISNVKTFHAFTRKLGQWCFHLGERGLLFYHPLFLQVNWWACDNIRCQTYSRRKVSPIFS